MRKISPQNHTGGESQHAYFHTSSIVKHRHPILTPRPICNTTGHQHSLSMRSCTSIYEHLLPRLCGMPRHTVLLPIWSRQSLIRLPKSYIRYYLIFLNPIYIQFIYIPRKINVFRLFKYII